MIEQIKPEMRVTSVLETYAPKVFAFAINGTVKHQKDTHKIDHLSYFD